MKRWKDGCAIAATCLFVGAGCAPDDGARDRPRDEPPRASAEAHTETGVVILDQAVLREMDLKIARVESHSVPLEAKGYGEVMSSGALASQVAELVSVQTELERSTHEWQRVRTLYEQQHNTSLQALETAEATMKQDQVAVEAARLKLMADWGAQVAGQDDLPRFVRLLTALESALVEVHLPLGEPLESPPVSAELTAVGETAHPVLAEFIGPMPRVHSRIQGRAFLFLVRTNSLHLTPGTSVTARVELGGEPRVGVVIPESAVVRHQKQAWVYLQTDDKTFRRQRVDLIHAMGDGWLITQVLQPGNRIVVDGAQVLLSEELKSQIQVGD